jgi:hypothetical protein
MQFEMILVVSLKVSYHFYDAMLELANRENAMPPDMIKMTRVLTELSLFSEDNQERNLLSRRTYTEIIPHAGLLALISSSPFTRCLILIIDTMAFLWTFTSMEPIF